jgi:putative tryptophan/tyrosine transport system substrate-binding protein
MRRFPPFASSRPGPQGFDPKAAVPACAPGELYCVLDAAPIGPRPCRFVLVFVRLWLHEDGMHRRRFIALLGAAITAARALRAQQKAMRVIGWLYGSSPPANPDDLIHGPVHQGLSETGFVEGQNMMSEYRSADFHYDRLPALAADLVSRKVDLIVTFGGAPPALAAKNATSTIPIVFTDVGDPIGFGLVASLAQPGGNLTGFSNLTIELIPKRLELLCELVPQAAVIALLVDPDNEMAEKHIRTTH